MKEVTREMIEKAQSGVFCRPNGIWGNNEVFGGAYRTEKEAIVTALLWYQMEDSLATASEEEIERVYSAMENEYLSYLCRRGHGKWKKK